MPNPGRNRRIILFSGSAPVAPVNTVAPAVTGDIGVGEVLTSTDGTWTGTAPITFTYQWQRNGVDIAGETNNTYTIVTADLANNIVCVVTASNPATPPTVSANSNTIVPFNFILDEVPGAAAFWSFFKGSAAYSGYCIKAYKTGDPTGQDIGFVNNVLDSASLLTYTGASSATFDWYDQVSGYTMSSSARPTIVSTGSLVLDNARAAASFDGSTQYLENTNATLANTPDASFLILAVIHPTDIAGGSTGGQNKRVMHIFNSGTKSQWVINESPADKLGNAVQAVSANAGTVFVTAQELLIHRSTVPGSDMVYKDGTSVGTGTFAPGNPSPNGTGFRIGGDKAGNNLNGQFIGYQQMWLVYQSDMIGSRATLEAIINGFFNIY